MNGEGASDGESRHAVLAGGGSGGHVFPALALAGELFERGWRVSLVGRSGGMEERLATERGLAFHRLAAAPVLGASPWRKLAGLAVTLRSAAAARRLLGRIGADVVVGLGGYVSAPTVVGARWLGLPILLFEPNAGVGLANRWLSRLAAEAAVAYPQAAGQLACPAVVTGVPVRAAFHRQPPEPATDRPSLLVLGGSQGARQLNEMVPRALALLGAAVRDLVVVHQAGAGNVEATEAEYRGADPELGRVEVVPFLDDVAAALGRAEIVVSRAGAITLAEICAVGRPAALVPLEIAAAHQRENAAALVEAGAAEMLAAGEDESALAEILGRLLENPEARRRMREAGRTLARPDAASRIADRLTTLVEAA